MDLFAWFLFMPWVLGNHSDTLWVSHGISVWDLRSKNASAIVSGIPIQYHSKSLDHLGAFYAHFPEHTCGRMQTAKLLQENVFVQQHFCSQFDHVANHDILDKRAQVFLASAVHSGGFKIGCGATVQRGNTNLPVPLVRNKKRPGPIHQHYTQSCRPMEFEGTVSNSTWQRETFRFSR